MTLSDKVHSNAIIRTVVQQLTTFQLTARRYDTIRYDTVD